MRDGFLKISLSEPEGILENRKAANDPYYVVQIFMRTWPAALIGKARPILEKTSVPSAVARDAHDEYWLGGYSGI